MLGQRAGVVAGLEAIPERTICVGTIAAAVEKMPCAPTQRGVELAVDARAERDRLRIGQAERLDELSEVVGRLLEARRRCRPPSAKRSGTGPMALPVYSGLL